MELDKPRPANLKPVQLTPEMQAQARDQVVLREIFAQEATKRGIAISTLFFGLLADRFGRKTIIVPSNLLTVISMVALALALDTAMRIKPERHHFAIDAPGAAPALGRPPACCVS